MNNLDNFKDRIFKQEVLQQTSKPASLIERPDLDAINTLLVTIRTSFYNQ